MNNPDLLLRRHRLESPKNPPGHCRTQSKPPAENTPAKKRQYELGQRVDLNNFDLSRIKVSQVVPEKIIPGINLYYGEIQGDVPPEQEQWNRLWSRCSIVWRKTPSLAPAEDPFVVRFGDADYSTLREFLTALKASGHRIEVSLRLQGADIPDLSQKIDGKFVKVAVPGFTEVDVVDAQGRRALVPFTPHLELSMKVIPPERTHKAQ
ncbi:MAG: hypothetical protein R3C68_09175 [Myxococcota bacterium]